MRAQEPCPLQVGLPAPRLSSSGFRLGQRQGENRQLQPRGPRHAPDLGVEQSPWPDPPWGGGWGQGWSSSSLKNKKAMPAGGGSGRAADLLSRDGWISSSLLL